MDFRRLKSTDRRGPELQEARAINTITERQDHLTSAPPFGAPSDSLWTMSPRSYASDYSHGESHFPKSVSLALEGYAALPLIVSAG
jgi:hypothetical protein